MVVNVAFLSIVTSIGKLGKQVNKSKSLEEVFPKCVVYIVKLTYKGVTQRRKNFRNSTKSVAFTRGGFASTCRSHQVRILQLSSESLEMDSESVHQSHWVWAY